MSDPEADFAPEDEGEGTSANPEDAPGVDIDTPVDDSTPADQPQPTEVVDHSADESSDSETDDESSDESSDSEDAAA